jgi:hypothetical protein
VASIYGFQWRSWFHGTLDGRLRTPIPHHEGRLDQLTANLAALGVTLTAEQIASLDAVSMPPLSFPAGYAQISQMFGFPGTRIDGVQMHPSPMLAASTARY